MFRLSIVTPERQFYDEQVEMVILPGTDGQIGVLQGHMHMAAVVVDGDVRILRDGRWRNAIIGAGFAEVLGDRTTVLVQTAEWPENIDRRRAEQSLEMAQERLRQAQSMREYTLSKAMMARAMARLRGSSTQEIHH